MASTTPLRISPNIALLTKAIQSAPGLGFTLGLAEMRLYQTAPGKDWPLLVVPEVVGRTVEQTRGVVRIQYVQEKPTVTVAVERDEGDGGTIGKLDSDQMSIVRQKEIASWSNDPSLSDEYLNALEPSPVVVSHARSGKMWIKYASLSPIDLGVLLRAARQLVQHVGVKGQL
jgi:hypothetical protein